MKDHMLHVVTEKKGQTEQSGIWRALNAKCVTSGDSKSAVKNAESGMIDWYFVHSDIN